MIAAIDAAQESLYMEPYIWKGDEVGQEFKERLARKARQGVEVYAIYGRFANLVVPNDFKVFPPEMHVLQYQGFRRLWHIFDPRHYALDHRKLLVVDGTIGFIGGYNLGNLYPTSWPDNHPPNQGPASTPLPQSLPVLSNHPTPLPDH